MSNHYDYTKFAILYVDDEEMSLKYFTRAFGDQFRILTASNAQDGAIQLEQHQNEIGLLMTDQRMPGENGVWLLEKSRRMCPSIIRVLVTAYSDMEAAISAVNSGAIYKFITKPWDLPELETTLKRGLEFFMVERERDHLLREKMSVLHQLLTGDRILSLGMMTAGLSHHIRNALVSVKTFLDLVPVNLREELPDGRQPMHPEFWDTYHHNVMHEVDKINTLLRDLWDASEKKTFAFNDSVRLDEILDEVLRSLNPRFEEKRIEVRVKIPDSLPPLKVDRPKFLKLFELLFIDEIVSLPEGSWIEVLARSVRDDLDQPEVQIEVRDNGPHLPQEHLRYIFDPFVARSNCPMEYGINLMACYFIVNNHGGRIGATASAAGKGTTFALRFPLDPTQSPRDHGQVEAVKKQHLNDTLWENTLAVH